MVFQDSVLDKPLTVKENLKSRAALYGITGRAFEERLKELLELLEFGDYLNRPVGKLSGRAREEGLTLQWHCFTDRNSDFR